jgi:hypothetical protein
MERPISFVVLAGLAAVSLSACDTSSNPPVGPTSPIPPASTPAPTPPSSVPAIANITAHFSDNTCTRAADGHTGRALVIAFDYVDRGDDLSGGHVQIYRVYNTGRSESHSQPVPSQVTLTGTAETGQLRIDNACPLYDNATSETETLTLVDASGQASNSLSVTMTRPPGAP